MTREEILNEIDEAVAELKDAKVKVNEALCHARNIVNKEDDAEAYNKGLEDAWKLARKIFTFNNNKMEEIFGVAGKRSAFDDLSPQVALAKLEAYEKEQNQLKVGDVVTIFPRSGGEYNAVVVRETNDMHIDAIYSDGITTCNVPPELYKKTGKHIDLTDLFKQIGGAE